MTLTEKLRLSLRIKTDAYDDEINALVESCKKELNMAGVSVIDESDATFIQAATLYCKSRFGLTDDADRWTTAFNALRDSMALSKEYGVVQNPEDE